MNQSFPLYVDFQNFLHRSPDYYIVKAEAVVNCVYEVYYESFDQVIKEERQWRVPVINCWKSFDAVYKAINEYITQQEVTFNGKSSVCMSSTLDRVVTYSILTRY